VLLARYFVYLSLNSGPIQCGAYQAGPENRKDAFEINNLGPFLIIKKLLKGLILVLGIARF
jgi:hypothetical protein